MAMTQYKYLLADMPSPVPPPIHPATHEPIRPEANTDILKVR